MSWLPFDDQLTCRLVCKDWLDLLTALPEFKSRNCLSLDYCTLAADQEPITSLQGSQLQFGALKIEPKLHLEFSPAIPSFLAQIGETVTYLNISKGGFSDAFRVIVEHLHLFKVLHHFNVGSPSEWLRIAYSSSPGQDVMKMILHMMTGDGDSNVITYESAKKFLEDETIGDFRQSLILRRHKELLLEKIRENLEQLNDTRRAWNQRQQTIDSIVREVETQIREIDNAIDLSIRSNHSVRVLTWKLTDQIEPDEVERIFVLTPNVKEINVDGSYLSDSLIEVLKTYADKVTALAIREEEVSKIQSIQLPQLQSIRFRNEYCDFNRELVERCVDMYPTLKRISICTSSVPQSHFAYITELTVQRKTEHQVQLSELEALKNLKILKVSLWSHLIVTEESQLCFFGHEPVSLEKVRKLKFNSCLGPACMKCIETMLQSLPNLRDLDAMDDHEGQFVGRIFQYQQNLEKLKILSRERTSSFEPHADWPEMKKLKVLILSFDSIRGDRQMWDAFGRKLKRLKYLQVNAHNCVELLEMIGSNMPMLQQIGILVRTRSFYPTLYPIKMRTIIRNGRKLRVDEYGP